MIDLLVYAKEKKRYYALRPSKAGDCSDCAFADKCVGDGDSTMVEGIGCKDPANSGKYMVWSDEGETMPQDLSNFFTYYVV